jgi:hypothetical protein
VDKDNLFQELIKLFVELFFVLLALALCEYDGLLELWKAEFSVVVHISGPHEARPQSHLSNSEIIFKAHAHKESYGLKFRPARLDLHENVIIG